MSKRLLNQSRESLIYLRENDKKIAVGWKEHISNYPRAKFWPIFKSYCMIEGSLLRVSPEAWPQEVIRADWRFPQLDLHLSIYSQTHESHLKVQQLTTTLTIICWCAEICSDFGVKNTKISAELGIWYAEIFSDLLNIGNAILIYLLCYKLSVPVNMEEGRLCIRFDDHFGNW